MDEPTQPATRFNLSRSLWKAGRDRPRARALARQARQDFARSPRVDHARLEKVDAWIAEIGAE